VDVFSKQVHLCECKILLIIMCIISTHDVVKSVEAIVCLHKLSSPIDIRLEMGIICPIPTSGHCHSFGAQTSCVAPSWQMLVQCYKLRGSRIYNVHFSATGELETATDSMLCLLLTGVTWIYRFNPDSSAVAVHGLMSIGANAARLWHQ
jgi:hypothetical protein